MQHYAIKVSGRVQGVFFRQSAKERALQLGLAGFARNEPDGTVYIEAEGYPGQLEQFLAWCRQGPRLATVEQVDHTKRTPAGHEGFSTH